MVLHRPPEPAAVTGRLQPTEIQEEEMPWKAWIRSRFSSSQGLVQSFATRAKVASCMVKCSVSGSQKKVAAIFIPKCWKAQKLLPCGHCLRQRSLVSAQRHGLM